MGQPRGLKPLPGNIELAYNPLKPYENVIG
jgi:hypothetical protein